METLDDRLKDIAEVRSLMERSSKFLSLSGLSGISAGLAGLAGSAFAYVELNRTHPSTGNGTPGVVPLLVVDAVIVLVFAVGLAIFFSVRLAKRKDLPVWTAATRFLVTDLLIPLSSGGVLCIILWYHGVVLFMAPTTLVFYGLALLNASKYTVPEIRYLAFSELALGLMAFLWLDVQLLFWACGFGLLHILYGVLLYRRYEQ